MRQWTWWTRSVVHQCQRGSPGGTVNPSAWRHHPQQICTGYPPAEAGGGTPFSYSIISCRNKEHNTELPATCFNPVNRDLLLCKHQCWPEIQQQLTALRAALLAEGKVFVSGEILAEGPVKQSLVAALRCGSGWHSPLLRTPVWKTSRCACHSLYGSSFTQC